MGCSSDLAVSRIGSCNPWFQNPFLFLLLCFNNFDKNKFIFYVTFIRTDFCSVLLFFETSDSLLKNNKASLNLQNLFPKNTNQNLIPLFDFILEDSTRLHFRRLQRLNFHASRFSGNNFFV